MTPAALITGGKEAFKAVRLALELPVTVDSLDVDDEPQAANRTLTETPATMALAIRIVRPAGGGFSDDESSVAARIGGTRRYGLTPPACDHVWRYK
jgi:hypothetical protein